MIGNYLINHLRAFLFSLGSCRQKPLTNLLTILAIGIALSFPLTLLALIMNIEKLTHSRGIQPTISLYLKSALSEKEISTLIQKIKSYPEVSNIKYISPEQGLQDFKQQLGIEAALQALPQNPLPGVIEIIPNFSASEKQLKALMDAFTQMPTVETSQLDTLWIQRLLSWLTVGKYLVTGLFVLFGMGVILIIGNIMRLNAQLHRHEILVLRLTGASLPFIRRPFLYSGILYGIFGAFTAWILVSAFLFWLKKPVLQLAKNYAGNWHLSYLPWTSDFMLLLICIALGLISAWFSTFYYLRAPEIIE